MRTRAVNVRSGSLYDLNHVARLRRHSEEKPRTERVPKGSIYDLNHVARITGRAR